MVCGVRLHGPVHQARHHMRHVLAHRLGEWGLQTATIVIILTTTTIISPPSSSPSWRDPRITTDAGNPSLTITKILIRIFVSLTD
jgi:hypothetical protein